MKKSIKKRTVTDDDGRFDHFLKHDNYDVSPKKGNDIIDSTAGVVP